NAPVADPRSVTTAQDSAVLLTLSGTDIDSTSLTFTIEPDTGPSHGTLRSIGEQPDCITVGNGSGTTPGSSCTAGVIYTPNSGYVGSDSVTFRVSDGSLSSTATIAITVIKVNRAPVLTVSGPFTVD